MTRLQLVRFTQDIPFAPNKSWHAVNMSLRPDGAPVERQHAAFFASVEADYEARVVRCTLKTGGIMEIPFEQVRLMERAPAQVARKPDKPAEKAAA